MTRALVAAALAGCVAVPSLLVAQVANGSTRDKLLVAPAWLAQHLHDPNLVVLQIGSKDAYDQGHIPGARYADWMELHMMSDKAEDLTLEMPAAGAIHDALESFGISDNSRVVLYASDGQWTQTTRVLLTFDYAGLSNVSVLDGGLKGWAAAGQPLSKDAPVATKGHLAPLKTQPIVVDADFVASHEHAPRFAIVDARITPFYDGTRAGGKPPTAGHIPGALSAPFNAFTTDDGRLKPADEIAAIFANAGVKPGDTIVGYCHIGQQATAMLFAARTLGHNVLLYDGSFEDWSRRGLPVENPAAKAAPPREDQSRASAGVGGSGGAKPPGRE
jgi:thiosulfate/3-mercaptopyruvate sulfurtransferase